MTHQHYLEQPYQDEHARLDHEEQQAEREWDLNYTEYIDHHGWDYIHPAIELQYRKHFDNAVNVQNFERWLDDQHAGDLIEWINTHHKQTNKKTEK